MKNVSDKRVDEPFERALTKAMRGAPEEVFPSVAGEVMHRLEARGRRLVTLRWAVAVATATLAGITVNAYGARVLGFMYSLVTRDVSATAEFLAYNKLVAVARMLGEVLTRVLFGGTLGADLVLDRAQVWALGAGAIAVVVFLMYLMGLWLRQPKGVRSWHFGRFWHNGTQAW